MRSELGIIRERVPALVARDLAQSFPMDLIILGVTFQRTLGREVRGAIDAVVLRPRVVVLLPVLFELGWGKERFPRVCAVQVFLDRRVSVLLGVGVFLLAVGAGEEFEVADGADAEFWRRVADPVRAAEVLGC